MGVDAGPRPQGWRNTVAPGADWWLFCDVGAIAFSRGRRPLVQHATARHGNPGVVGSGKRHAVASGLLGLVQRRIGALDPS